MLIIHPKALHLSLLPQLRHFPIGKQRIQVHELQVLEREQLAFTTRARGENSEHMLGQIKRCHANHKQQPIPDTYENYLVEEINTKNALDQIGMCGAHFTNINLAQGDTRKNVQMGPFDLVEECGDESETEYVEIVANETIEEEELTKSGEQVETFDHYVESG